MVSSKRSVIVHKKEGKIENIFQLLGEVERSILEFSRIFVEAPDSKHKTASGKMKLTEKQELILKQIKQANKMSGSLIQIIERNM